jgi:peptidyl-prolyl cis-trans isomerase C
MTRAVMHAECGVSSSVPSATVLARPAEPNRLRRLRREPLVQFLLIGVALFAIYRVVDPNNLASQSSRIVLTDDDLRQMTVTWLAHGRSTLTPAQMRSLIDQKVREEVLYREALSMGLDKDDTIVKRRLAQKMEFLAEDIASLRDPTEAELKGWFANNAARFTLPPRASFRHLYFSFDRRGQRARDDAAHVLQGLATKPGDWPGTPALADPFMYQDYYGDRSFDQLATEFGPPFAQSVVRLPPHSWQGPIESGYGWHLVWVDTLTSSRVPPFEEIEAEVKAQWVSDQRAEVKRKAFDAMRARYTVVLPNTPAPAGAPAGGGGR